MNDTDRLKLLAPLPFRVTGIVPHSGKRGVLDSYHDAHDALNSARRLMGAGFVDVRVEGPNGMWCRWSTDEG